jgi:hypothetical protein
MSMIRQSTSFFVNVHDLNEKKNSGKVKVFSVHLRAIWARNLSNSSLAWWRWFIFMLIEFICCNDRFPFKYWIIKFPGQTSMIVYDLRFVSYTIMAIYDRNTVTWNSVKYYLELETDCLFSTYLFIVHFVDIWKKKNNSLQCRLVADVYRDFSLILRKFD